MRCERPETVICERSDVQISFIWLKPLSQAAVLTGTKTTVPVSTAACELACVNSIEKFLKHVRYFVDLAVFVIAKGYIRRREIEHVQSVQSLTSP